MPGYQGKPAAQDLAVRSTYPVCGDSDQYLARLKHGDWDIDEFDFLVAAKVRCSHG